MIFQTRKDENITAEGSQQRHYRQTKNKRVVSVIVLLALKIFLGSQIAQRPWSEPILKQM